MKKKWGKTKTLNKNPKMKPKTRKKKTEFCKNKETNDKSKK
jgi:hypothetical protein